MRSPYHPSTLKSPVHPGSGGGKPGGSTHQGNRRRNEMVGETVKIVCGPYKGIYHLVLACHLQN